MSTWTLLHNPRCSKSRQTLALLEENNIKPEIVDYLKNPPSQDELVLISKKLNLRPRDFIRTKEEVFKDLKIDLEDEKAVIAAMAENPVLIERPIVVKEDKAVLGRPPENINELLGL